MSGFGDETYGWTDERNASAITRSFIYKEQTAIDVKGNNF
jgi:hypothetical protein